MIWKKSERNYMTRFKNLDVKILYKNCIIIIIIIIIIIDLKFSASICWDILTYLRLSVGLGTVRFCGRLAGFFISLVISVFLLVAVPLCYYISTVSVRLRFF